MRFCKAPATVYSSEPSAAMKPSRGRGPVAPTTAAEVPANDVDIEHLSSYVVNGRQIKTAIRLAQALAKAEGTAVTTELLERPLLHAERFLDDVAQEGTTTVVNVS